ncbi:methyltransferase-domain-containing protein [Dunaliella salina]|uniref:Ribosomal RNA-processing protein 8 n=1 Tax=Dunaliella salina TaxID=3046 RepID=A0ABQ7GNT3_DUNSA|nr:methyltransferase-domain-containing protein [Dunaliella salina]|eukprot:KAF5836254.1 methyltransferase-domain-containing protein [Dunaliella salina]
MASVPLDSASVDVAVFSLALMGTDYGAFLTEAARVLRHKGWLWIAEVRSRFTQEPDEEKDVGKANSQHLQPFLKCLARLGFTLQSLDASNKMFVVMVLRKLNVPSGNPSAITWPSLRACMYRKR